MAIDEATTELLEDILEDIATTANALRSSLYGTDSDCGRSHAHVVVATKIGWMADLALERLTGRPVVAGDAEDWFMSPRYHDIKQRAAEVGHG